MLRTSLSAFALLASLQHAWSQEDLDYQRMPGQAEDVSVSHNGARWHVGRDGRAYLWDVEAQEWVAHGARSNLARIDAGETGVVALTRAGRVLVRPADAEPQRRWRTTSMQARDIGLGNGLLWVSGGDLEAQPQATYVAALDAEAPMDWAAVSGDVGALDVDPAGRPWALDGEGRLYVYVNDAWLEDEAAPRGRDIGVGGDGTIYVTARDDGSVWRRDAITGAWLGQPGRLSAISAAPDGKAMGVTEDGWILAAVQDPRSEPSVFVESGENAGPLVQPGMVITLADILGPLPGADTILITIDEVSLDEAESALSVVGRAEILGVASRLVVFQPNITEPKAVLMLRQDGVDLANYIPQINASEIGSLGLAESVLFIPVGETPDVAWNSEEDLPPAIAAQMPKADDAWPQGLYPVELDGDVTVVGLFTPLSQQAGLVRWVTSARRRGSLATFWAWSASRFWPRDRLQSSSCARCHGMICNAIRVSLSQQWVRPAPGQQSLTHLVSTSNCRSGIGNQRLPRALYPCGVLSSASSLSTAKSKLRYGPGSK
ncbi:hypothetical protein ACS3SW_16860 [Roseobacteraceae bacterium S113]